MNMTATCPAVGQINGHGSAVLGAPLVYPRLASFQNGSFGVMAGMTTGPWFDARADYMDEQLLTILGSNV